MFTVKNILVVGGMLSTLLDASVVPPPAGWPKFSYQGGLSENLKYNPTSEFIFPSIFQASLYLEKPLGKWYLYYAPHENPGGICLQYAENIEGPWTEYASNPVISNVWPGKYRVPHVSSPDAVWNTQASKLFVYFHGTNSETRWAETTDGVNFTYGDIAVTNSMGGPNVTETSYARVFKHPNPSAGYDYGMFYMGNERDNTRRIRLAESVDGKVWTVSSAYVVTPGSEEAGNVSGADLWEWNGQLYVIYHASSGKSYARTIDATLRNVATVPILLHKASGVGEDTGRVASPNIVTTNGETYLFYESGNRTSASLAWAKAV